MNQHDNQVPGGIVHSMPTDLHQALTSNLAALSVWQMLTALGRNEYICWIEDAKQKPTRQRRILWALEQIQVGKRRPCCWPGCTHRERTGF